MLLALVLSFRAKLLATYVALVVVFGGGILIAVDRKLGDDLVAARAVAGWLGRSGNPPRLARRLANVVDARVTILDRYGIVLGDSAIDEPRLGIDPEGLSSAVEAARAGQVGREIRFSPLAGEELYYLAVPAGSGRVLRLAVATADMRTTRQGLRDRLLVISLIGFGAALLLGLLAVRAVARPLQRMTAQARRLAAGDYDADDVEPPLGSRDELGVLSRTLALLARQVRDRIDDLERERDLLSSVIGSLVEGVAVVGRDGRIALENPSARAILGQERGEELADPELRELVTGAGASGSAAEREVELRGRSLLVSAQPLRHRDAVAVLVVYDVTGLRRLETVRRDFVANLTHELRTPVTAIRGYAETLVSTGVDEPTRLEFLATIHRNAERIGRLVDDLLVLQELDARPAERPAGEPVELAAVVGHVARTVQDRVERAGATLRVNIAPGLRVLADADRLEQVIENLVDNAIKYGASDRRGGQVRVSSERDGEHAVRLVVEDDGPGIAPAHRERVFERFYRVDPGRSREHGGTGLGLAIVKHLAESMGGRVTLESGEGPGCRFVVELRGEVPA
jgi:two-component system, OmpR family, phosphate regulon sensor histidine kinase PhoR